MEYNGTKYWYDKNLQGDVVDIRNSTGTLIARYVYDAWGNHRQITDSSGNDVSADTSHIANINPFRYRGYYYDTETGWYYLNTRYYDPNVGRFLSPDVILGANGGLQGYNLFAYCNNNPVMFADPSGRSIILTGLAAKAATALGVLVTPIIAKGIADGLKATADLLDSGIQAIADLFSSSDDKPETVTVSPAPTIEDIENNILTFEERRPFSTFFPDSPSNNLSVIFRTPTEGEPNTDLEIKGPKNSRTVRHFGPDGKAEYDIDYWHPGAKHEFPHRHDWNWNNKISPRGKGYKIIINK